MTQGKVSAIFGLFSFSLAHAANTSYGQILNSGYEYPLEEIYNYLFIPLRFIEKVFLGSIYYNEPSFIKVPFFYIFRIEAIYLTYLVSLLFSIFAIYLAINSIKKYEDSFWYTNGIWLSTLSQITIYSWLGLFCAIVVVYIVQRLRNRMRSNLR